MNSFSQLLLSPQMLQFTEIRQYSGGFAAWRFLSPNVPACCSSVPPAVKSEDMEEPHSLPLRNTNDLASVSLLTASCF